MGSRRLQEEEASEGQGCRHYDYDYDCHYHCHYCCIDLGSSTCCCCCCCDGTASEQLVTISTSSITVNKHLKDFPARCSQRSGRRGDGSTAPLARRERQQARLCDPDRVPQLRDQVL